MTEEDTFKKLKGLTWQEADEMYDSVYLEAMASKTTVTVGDVNDYVNDRLRPYGWSIELVNQLSP